MNKRNPDPAFSGIALLSMLLGFNFFTILSFLELNHIIKLKGKVLYVVVLLGLLAINYFLLNKKSEAIIAFHRRKKIGEQHKWPLVAFCIYITVSLLLLGFTSYLVRNASNH